MKNTTNKCCGLSLRFDFTGTANGSSVYPSASAAQEELFVATFRRDLTAVKKWFDEHWPNSPTAEALPPAHPLGSYNPRADIEVFVSNEYLLSRSLVPAAVGQRGHMEFPASRVIMGEAAAAHEITHVYFPNGNRLLAEGLAIYLQQKVGKNPAYPNFGTPLHQAVRLETGPNSQLANCLNQINFAGLDKFATPVDLTIRIGTNTLDSESSVLPYMVAGSFVQFLIEDPCFGSQKQRAQKFHDLYMRTPLVPWEPNAGASDRWQKVYGRPIERLAAEWKSMIQGIKS